VMPAAANFLRYCGTSAARAIVCFSRFNCSARNSSRVAVSLDRLELVEHRRAHILASHRSSSGRPTLGPAGSRRNSPQFAPDWCRSAGVDDTRPALFVHAKTCTPGLAFRLLGTHGPRLRNLHQYIAIFFRRALRRHPTAFGGVVTKFLGTAPKFLGTAPIAICFGVHFEFRIANQFRPSLHMGKARACLKVPAQILAFSGTKCGLADRVARPVCV